MYFRKEEEVPEPEMEAGGELVQEGQALEWWLTVEGRSWNYISFVRATYNNNKAPPLLHPPYFENPWDSGKKNIETQSNLVEGRYILYTFNAYLCVIILTNYYYYYYHS